MLMRIRSADWPVQTRPELPPKKPPRMLRIGLIALVPMLNGCALPLSWQSQPFQATPAKDRGCQAFRPYQSSVEHLRLADKVWVAGHNASGAHYCGPEWLDGKVS
jgi:hypothetical protein